MPTCPNCGVLYYLHCLACEMRREELLRRLQVDDGVATFAEVAAMAAHGEARVERERVWRVG
jgi:hypothetical protein